MHTTLPDLVLFDLDNTLLVGDSDFAWNTFLCDVGAVEKNEFQRRNKAFYDDYQAGQLDIHAYLHFTLEPLTKMPREKLIAMREEFIKAYIEPMITQTALELIEKHQCSNNITAIITSTNKFITEPIAKRFKIKHLIATEPEFRNGYLTGKITNTPCYREGKLECLKQWLKQVQPKYDKTWFYSDSHNDLPLLSQVDRPVVVNGDPQLRAHAEANNWQMIKNTV